MTDYWHTIDVRPCPPGIRAIYGNLDTGEITTLPVLGWLVQDDGDGDPASRRIVPAILEELELMSGDESWAGCLLFVLGPDEELDEAEITATLERRQRLEKRLNERAAARAAATEELTPR